MRSVTLRGLAEIYSGMETKNLHECWLLYWKVLNIVENTIDLISKDKKEKKVLATRKSI